MVCSVWVVQVPLHSGSISLRVLIDRPKVLCAVLYGELWGTPYNSLLNKLI